MSGSVRPGGSKGAAKRTGSGTRAQAAQSTSTPRREFDGGHWAGAAFYVQIERCAGVAKQSCSVRLEEELYLQKALALKANIDEFFEEAIQVEVLDVPTLYALEVRVMRDEWHPRHGRQVFGQEAVSCGAKTLFSKVACKKWPKALELCARLQDFSRIPASFQMLCKEQPQGVRKDGALPLEVRSAINSKGGQGGPKDELLPLDHATFRVIHSTCKEELVLWTDAEGRTQEVLHPGKFELRCEQGNYDKLEPSHIEIPALFQSVQFTIVAKMKKRCAFHVVDHLNRPYPRFPLRITPRDASAADFATATKANGQAKGRLGVGLHTASYDGQDPSQWPVEPFAQDLEVQDIDAHQLFRICVKRLRFACEIVLRTRFDEPVRRCHYSVRDRSKIIASGATSDLGVASCELPSGALTFHLEPDVMSPFVATQFDLQVKETGPEPLNFQVETKSVNVDLSLITPDGEPAPFCQFLLKARFTQDGAMSSDDGLSLCSDGGGRVCVALALLEPYVFSVKPSRTGSEYMPQEFSFLTDRQSLTLVVARSLLGVIAEEKVIFVVDASGSMQAYLEDVKSAVNLALMQQFHRTRRQFNILTFTEGQILFRDDLVQATPNNLEDAMRFCQLTQAGGCSNLSAVRAAFTFQRADAIYVITDGKAEVTDDLLSQVKVHYLGHPKRPKLHAVGINCVPGRAKHRALQSLAHLTQGSFRSVCLEQDTSMPMLGQKVGLNFEQFVTTDEETVTDAVDGFEDEPPGES